MKNVFFIAVLITLFSFTLKTKALFDDVGSDDHCYYYPNSYSFIEHDPYIGVDYYCKHKIDVFRYIFKSDEHQITERISEQEKSGLSWLPYPPK